MCVCVGGGGRADVCMGGGLERRYVKQTFDHR